MSSLEIRDSMVRGLRTDLVGPMASDEVLSSPPSRWYLTGFLVPTDAPPEQRQDLESSEEISNELASGREDDDPSAAPPRANGFPSSLGLSVLVPAGTQHLDLTLSWSEYEQLDAEQTEYYKALDAERSNRKYVPPEEGDKTPRFLYWQLKRQSKRQVRVLLNTELQSVPNTSGLQLRVVRRPVRSPGVPKGTESVAVFWVNNRAAATKAADTQFLFQAKLQVRCPAGFVPRPQQAQATHPDDRRSDLQFRERAEWVVGHGVSGHALVNPDGSCQQVESAWIPQADVFRMAAEEKGVELSMDHWGAVSSPELVQQAAQGLATAYEAWLSAQEALIPDLETEARKETAGELIATARLAKARILDGAQALGEHPELFLAFKLANRAMARASEYENPRWRLFQFAFLLLNLRGVAEPGHADRETVDLLFFPTGGGKTEAYLGVAALTMFLRRIKGQSEPHGGLGVTVLLRYTLRLLTLDQLGRAARLVCAMELERLTGEHPLGLDPFGVGLWVGKKATPLRMKEAREVLRKYMANPSSSPDDSPLPIENCPWCKTRFAKESFDIPRGTQRLEVACANPGCEFSRGEIAGALPLSVVDEQIYRELPEFLIGTVDKFAALPWRGAVGSLFGKVRGRNKDGFVGEHENPPNGTTSIPGGLLPPELVIQDELHLISGPLGTMVGLYEAVLDALSVDPQGHRPKVVASTATARRSQEQIQALYARPVSALFPPQGLNDGDTFFAKTDTAPETARRYVGISAPGRSMKAVIARVYASLLSSSQYAFNQHSGKGPNPADPYMTLAAYFNSLKDLGGTQRLVSEEIAPRLKIMDRRRCPLQQDKSTFLAARNIGFDALELTSRQSTGDIRKAKALLDLPYGPTVRSDVLLASSMISVGVDIDRLGLMVVNGQPKTVAEYIQASSRVGRSHPGLVVTLLSNYRPRDRSHYERFTCFHESFYRFVEANSVTPFSPRALDRGLAGAVIGLARHSSPRMAHARAAQLVHKATELEDKLVQVFGERAQAHHRGGSPEEAKAVGDRVRELVQAWRVAATKAAEGGTRLSYSPWERRDAKTKGTMTLLRSFIDEPQEPHLEPFAAPTSMRDVEPSVHIWVRRLNELAEDAELGEEEML